MKVFATLCLAGAASAYKLARSTDGLEVSQLSQKDALMELAQQEEIDCDWSGDAEFGTLGWHCYDKSNDEHSNCYEGYYYPIDDDGNPCDNYCANDGLD